MFPFHLPLWETDATLRAAVTQSAQASVTTLGSGAVLLGGEVSADARAASERAAYLAALHVAYAHAFDVALGGGAGPPSYNLDADTTLSAGWTPTPRSFVTLDTEASLATTYGVHADTQLLALDPFLFAQRLEYGFSHTLGVSFDPTARAGFDVEVGYLQTGALSAEAIQGVPMSELVGVDTHEGHASVSYSYEVGPRDSITPELRYDFAHYYHALLDATLHLDQAELQRGPADIHTGTFSLAASHELARGLTLRASGGVSVGTPMPAVHADHPVVAPDASLSLRWTGRRARVTARADYAYTSLGPRVGFGQQLSATLKVDARPLEGVRYRDLLLHGTLRFAHGSAPLGADPAAVVPGMPILPATGTLTTTTLAAATRVEIPIARGIAFTTGGELAFARGVVDAEPALSQASSEVLATISVGLSFTVSTDKRRAVPKDPEADQEEEARRLPTGAGNGGDGGADGEP